MSNMSYCRFENTLGDLYDCYRHMDDDNLSKSEQQERRQLIMLCSKIVEDYLEEFDE